MIKVSIIVPVYNTEAYLDACLESLVYQTLKEIEIIIINDGSTDGSVGIIERFQHKFPDRIMVLNKENGGQASARNLGLQCCRGNYVGFVDSDDVVAREMYETLYRIAVSEQADMVECDYQYIKVKNGKQIPLFKYAEVRPRNGQKDLFINPLVSPWNKLYRAGVLRKSGVIFPEGLIYEDTAFYINLIPWLEKLAFSPEEYVIHFSRDDSTQTKRQNPRVGDMIRILETIIAYYRSNHFWEKYCKELEYFCIKIMLCSCLGRIALLNNKTLKKQLLKQIIHIIEREFPNFRKNPYLGVGLRDIYLKSCNAATIYFYAGITGLIYNLKMHMHRTKGR